MADLTNFYKSDVTLRSGTAGDTAAQEITAYTVAWSDLTGAGFANGNEVLVIMSICLAANSTTNNAESTFGYGSTFAGRTVFSTNRTESDSATTSLGARRVTKMIRMTLTTNDNFYTSIRILTTSTPNAQDFMFWCIKLGDLVENTDYKWGTHSTSGDASTSPTDGASVTLPSGGGDDWLVLADIDWLIDSTAANCLHGLSLDGSTVMTQSIEGEDTAETLSFGLVGYLAAASASAVCKVTYNVDTGTTNDVTGSQIFALRMERFVDHVGSINATPVSMGGVIDTYVQTNTATLSLTTTGNVMVFAQTIADVTNAVHHPYKRVQLDNANIVLNLGRRALAAYNSDTQVAPTVFVRADSTSSGSRTFDVDCAEDNINNNYNFDEHTLVAFSLALVSGSTVASTDTLFLKDPGPERQIAKQLQTPLFLRDSPIRDAQRLLRDNAFLFSSASAQINKAASVVDTLLLNPTYLRDFGRVIADPVFIDSIRSSDRALLQAFAMLVGDLSVPSAERVVEAQDAIFAHDFDALERVALLVDRVLLAETVVRELYKLGLDSLFVHSNTAWREDHLYAIEYLFLDSLATLVQAVEHTRDVIDTLLLDSAYTITAPSVQQITQIDNLLVDTLRTFNQARVVVEALPIDSALRKVMERVVGDQALLLSQRVESVRESLLRSNLFLLDSRASTQEIMLTSALLLDSAVNTIQPGGYTRLAIDTLFVDSVRTSTFARSFTDAVLVGAERLSTIERDITDRVLFGSTMLKVLEMLRASGLLLGETAEAAKAGAAIRTAIDAILLYDTVTVTPSSLTLSDSILLGDARLAELARVLRSNLLIGAIRTSALEKGASDSLLLYDIQALLREVLHVVNVTDPLPLSDVMIKLQQSTIDEAALLLASAASVGKEVARELADAMLLLDRRANDREFFVADAVLVAAFAQRVQEILAQHELLLYATGTAQWYPNVIEFITYARLSVSAILGISTKARDLLGRRYAFVDPLGLDLSYSRWRVDMEPSAPFGNMGFSDGFSDGFN